MSILIEGMEMPKGGYIDVRIFCDGTAFFAIAKNPYFKEVEAVPVPEPYGRLIDADALEVVVESHYKHHKISRYERDLLLHYLDVEMAPTVIPANPPKEET